MKKKVGINIDKDLHFKAKQLALNEEITISELYERILNEYFQNKKLNDS